MPLNPPQETEGDIQQWFDPNDDEFDFGSPAVGTSAPPPFDDLGFLPNENHIDESDETPSLPDTNLEIGTPYGIDQDQLLTPDGNGIATLSYFLHV